MLTKKERLHKFYKKFNHSLTPYRGEKTPIFICGEQRSGTNFLINVLNRCRDTMCYLENDEEAFDDYVLRDMDVLKSLVEKSKAKTVVFKPICDSQNLSSLLETFPNAKVIWTFRRYEDVVNSSLRRFSQHKKYLDLMLNKPEEAAWRVQNVTQEHMDLVRHYYDDGNITDASARTLVWYLRNSLFYQQGLDTDSRVIVTKYEDLVTKPVECFEKVYAFLEMKNNPKAADIAFSSSMNKNEPPEVDPEITQRCEDLYNKLLAYYEAQN